MVYTIIDWLNIGLGRVSKGDTMKKEFVQILVAVMLMLVGFSSTGCAVMSGGNSIQKLHANSDPQKAEVRVNGALQGITPCDVFLERGVTNKIAVSLSGYDTFSFEPETEIRWGMLALDLVPYGGGIPADLWTKAYLNYKPFPTIVLQKTVVLQAVKPAPQVRVSSVKTKINVMPAPKAQVTQKVQVPQPVPLVKVSPQLPSKVTEESTVSSSVKSGEATYTHTTKKVIEPAKP